MDAGTRTAFIRLGAPLSKETALKILEKKSAAETRIEWKGLVPYTTAVRRAGRLFLGEERRASTQAEAALDLPRYLSEAGFEILPWKDENNAARRLLERIRFFASHSQITGGTAGDSNDDWSNEALLKNSSEWLIPFIETLKSREKNISPVITYSSLVNALKGRLGWDKSEILESEVPEIFITPRGRKRTLDYSSGSPVLSIRLQDCFGISAHPRIMGELIIFHLLSPADRPVQITSDISGFWSGSYIDVRKEMKGRYPKHSWPENPLY